MLVLAAATMLGAAAPADRRLLCATPQVEVDADFPGGGGWRCIIEAEDRVAILVAQDRPPPINPSPWYALRYRLKGDRPVTLRLQYLNAEHRYQPKVSADGRNWRAIDPAAIESSNGTAAFRLPADATYVASQEIIDSAHHGKWLRTLDRRPGTSLTTIGRSHDGRPIEALTFGNRSSSRIVLLLGRQHPPEISGALAMNAFLEALLDESKEARDLRDSALFVAVPLLNPDGVDRGYWRTNLGGVDINRDWGDFTQPETRAVRDHLAGLVARGKSPILAIDFHSTMRNLFYTQGEADSAPIHGWTKAWLGRSQSQLAGYDFTLEPRNANRGSGTAKNYFFETYRIPSVTYEVGDETDRAAIASSAKVFARTLQAELAALPGLDPARP